MFFGIEGLEGTGKSTIIPLVVEQLKKSGLSTTVKPEFPIGKLDSEFRSVLDKGLFLAQHLEMPAAAAFFYLLYAEVISVKSTKPEDTDIVLADRCHFTHAIYQAHFTCEDGQTLDVVGMLDQLEGMFAILDVQLPDIVIILDASVEDVVPRLEKRERRKVTSEELPILKIFHSYYHQLAAHLPDRVLKISAKGSPEEVATNVSDAIKEKLGQTMVLHSE
jgi:thymidylate kinase